MNLSPLLIQRFTDNNGNALIGGLLSSYIAGTSTPQATYTDSTGSTSNTNPVVANSRGEANVWIPPNTAYKFVLTDAAGNLIWTEDNVIVFGFTNIGQSLTPNVTNVYNIGSPSFTWANGYFGTQVYVAGTPVVTYPKTAAETIAGVSPTVLILPTPIDPQRYGAVGDGVTDDTVAVQNAFNVAGAKGGVVKVRDGLNFRCTADITVPVAAAFSTPLAGLEGYGWANPCITFDGAGVTNGLKFIGSAYNYAGSVREACINMVNGAKGGIVYNNCNHPTVDHVWMQGHGGSVGRGVYFVTCLLPRLANSLVVGFGSATQGSVEVDTCTNFRWDHSRISGGTTTVGGILIDRAGIYKLTGGNIESVGTPILIGSKAEAALECDNGEILGLDLENPGNNNPYISLGAGMSGTALVNGLTIDDCRGVAGASTPVPYAIKFANCQQVIVGGGNTLLPVSGTSQHELVGTNNSGIYVRPSRGLQSNTIPWVRYNGVQVLAAGCQHDWFLAPIQGGKPLCSHRGLIAPYLGAAQLSGATPSILISATAGGYYGCVNMANGGGTTVTSLSGGEAGMEITIIANDGNTTLTYGTTGGTFRTTTGANIVLAAGRAYRFINDGAGGSGGSCWVQY